MLYENDQNGIDQESIPDFAMKPAQEFKTDAYDNLLNAVKETFSVPEDVLETQAKIEDVVETHSRIDEEAVETHAEAAATEAIEVSSISIPEESYIEEGHEATMLSKEVMSYESELTLATDKEIATAAHLNEENHLNDKDYMEPVIPVVSPIKIIPMTGSVITSALNVMDVKDKPKTRIYIEEDLLVPDIKPDLSEILSMDGKIKLAEREMKLGQNGAETIKIMGDLVVQTLYIPETGSDKEPMISIESRIPFKSDYNVGAAPNSQVLMLPEIETLEFTRINERKFKIKATVILFAKEYQDLQVSIFEGIRDEEVQMLKEKINVTNVAIKVTEDIEVREELTIKDSQPYIGKILKYDINLIENHKQILKEKAVINGSLHCNILYLGCIDEAHPEPEPTLYQGKTEFTHFIKLNQNEDECEMPAGGKASFYLKSFSLTIKESESEEEFQNTFIIEADIDTTVEAYRNVEKEVVTDIYHSRKDTNYDTEELCLRSLSGGGASEQTIREIITIPERYGTMDKVSFITPNLKESTCTIDEGRIIIEGFLNTKIICMPFEETSNPFSFDHQIPFRSVMDIPGISGNMNSENTLTLKDIWFDKINDKQIELNAGIAISAATSYEEKYRIVKNVSFIEGIENKNYLPALVLYITKSGDNIWKIAKKFRTTIDAIKRLNDLDYATKLTPGTKLLIEKIVV